MEQAKGFDMSKMSMASKILLGAGILAAAFHARQHAVGFLEAELGN